MSKIVDYINNNEVDHIVQSVVKSNKNIDDVIHQCLDARKYIGLKMQELIEKLREVEK